MSDRLGDLEDAYQNSSDDAETQALGEEIAKLKDEM